MMGAMLPMQDLPVHQAMRMNVLPPRPTSQRRNPHGKRAQRRLSKPWAGRRT